MGRYLRVLGLFWSTAIAAELEYRLNFLLATLTSLGGLAGSLFGLFLFYRTGYQFPGWSWAQALLVLGFFTLLQGFAATLLSPNLSRIVTQVQQGTLDFVLLKPISSQFWLSTRAVSPWGLPDLAFGLILVLVVSLYYNSLVVLGNRFQNAFSQIDVQLKRRYALIPNLVECVKGYMAHEKTTLEAVIQASHFKSSRKSFNS